MPAVSASVRKDTIKIQSMKLKLPLIALAALLAIPATRADQTTPATPPPAGEHGPEHKGHRGDRLKMLAEKLDLSDDQKAKIKPIIEDEVKSAKAVHEDASLDRKAKWAKIEEIRKAHREQIKALLTPDQVKKLEELKEERGPRPGGPGHDMSGEHKPSA